MKKYSYHKNHRSCFFPFLLWMCFCSAILVYGAEDTAALTENYVEYRLRFDEIDTMAQIEANGFRIIQEQVFPLTLYKEGEVSFVPALDNQSNRLVLFLVKKDGTVLYKTDQLETNNQSKGELKQPNKGLAAVSFQDVNEDGLTDILLITFCEHKNGSEAGQLYKVGDVLFQQQLSNKQVLFRDYRISDTLNQYGMNKSIKFMTSYLVKGYSTEFLYTANTLLELETKGFRVSTNQSFWSEFEKWGKLYVAAGTYSMAEYTVFMVYLVNEQGYIVWSFQPMKAYESLYALRGIACRDIDGDGLKDLVVLGRYIFEETDNESVIRSDYSVYYQRGEGFYEDTEVKNQYRCSDEDELETIVEKLYTYWGWN